MSDIYQSALDSTVFSSQKSLTLTADQGLTQRADVALLGRWLRGGGAERILANLAQGFAAQGLQVDLLLLRAEGIFLDQIPATVRIVELRTNKPKPAWQKYVPTSLESTRSLKALCHYLKTQPPKVLIAGTHYLNEIAILAKQLTGAPTQIVVTEHTSPSMEAHHAEQRSARSIPWTMKALYPWADQIIAVSHGVAQDVAAITGIHDRLEVIYNPVLLPDLQQRGAQPVDHPWFQETADIPIILGAGRLVRQKDFATLIRAFALVRQVAPARLVLLGEGGQKKELQHLAETLAVADDVALLPFVDNPYAYMAKAQVFASSSLWEGLSTVAIEALGLGIPVVATHCPSGSAEILQRGQYGKLVPMGDAIAMATALTESLQQPKLQAPETWLRQFTLGYAIEQYVAVLGLQGCKSAVKPIVSPVTSAWGRPSAIPGNPEMLCPL
jgi:glycosyltransferase involved in cell wall biosynthesis